MNLSKRTLFIIAMLLMQHGNMVAQNAATKESTDKNEKHFIGETFGGGIIFYLDSTGEHGLIAAPYDQKTNATWGFFENEVTLHKVALGSGLQNTRMIAKAGKKQRIAAIICYNLELNGYKDWYLPSLDEMSLIHKNLYLKQKSKFNESMYWTSSETDFNNAWLIDFKSGFSVEQNVNTPACVRAIRSF